MCTINKSAHTKKKSGNLFNDPRINLSNLISDPLVEYLSCSTLEFVFLTFPRLVFLFSPTLSLSLSLSYCLTHPLYICMCACTCVYVCVCVCVYVCASLSLCLKGTYCLPNNAFAGNFSMKLTLSASNTQWHRGHFQVTTWHNCFIYWYIYIFGDIELPNYSVFVKQEKDKCFYTRRFSFPKINEKLFF